MLGRARLWRTARVPPFVRMFMDTLDRTSDPVFSRSSPRFTATQGQYLAFTHTYAVLHREPPAETDFQRFFQVTPPAVHDMIVALERRGLISRVPRQPRTIRLFLSPDELPPLQSIKMTAMGYNGSRPMWIRTSTVYRTKQHCVDDGVARALTETPRPGAPRKLSASDEACLVAVACSAPPVGRAHWTLDLLAGALIRLTPHATVSRATVGRRLAALKLKPWWETMWSFRRSAPSTCPAWKMCSPSTPRRRTHVDRWSA